MDRIDTAVTIGCPIRNRAWIFPEYWNRILSLDYPKELIDIRFVINDSVDDTRGLLLECAEKYAALYKSFRIMEFNLNAGPDDRTYKSRIKIFDSLAKVRNYWLSLSPAGNWVFSVDSDILVEQHTLSKLLGHDKAICGAFISNEAAPKPNNQSRGNAMRWANHSRISAVHIIPATLGSLMEVDVTGAVYLLNPEVASRVKYGFDRQGEDIYFCREAQNLGFSIYCDTAQILTHVMDKVRYSRGRPAPTNGQSSRINRQ